jgi:hypothetical protein
VSSPVASGVLPWCLRVWQQAFDIGWKERARCCWAGTIRAGVFHCVAAGPSVTVPGCLPKKASWLGAHWPVSGTPRDDQTRRGQRSTAATQRQRRADVANQSARDRRESVPACSTFQRVLKLASCRVSLQGDRKRGSRPAGLEHHIAQPADRVPPELNRPQHRHPRQRPEDLAEPWSQEAGSAGDRSEIEP